MSNVSISTKMSGRTDRAQAAAALAAADMLTVDGADEDAAVDGDNSTPAATAAGQVGSGSATAFGDVATAIEHAKHADDRHTGAVSGALQQVASGARSAAEQALASLTAVQATGMPQETFVAGASSAVSSPAVFYVRETDSVLGRHTIGGGVSVSRRHATLSLRYDDANEKSWWLEPIGRNKITVNGRHFSAAAASEQDQLTTSVEIWGGDLITFGKTRTLRFRTDETAGQSNTYAALSKRLLGSIPPENSTSGGHDSRALVRDVVRVQSTLRIEASLPLRDTLVKAQELLQLPPTLGSRAAVGSAGGVVSAAEESEEALALAADRVLKLLSARGHSMLP